MAIDFDDDLDNYLGIAQREHSNPWVIIDGMPYVGHPGQLHDDLIKQALPHADDGYVDAQGIITPDGDVRTFDNADIPEQVKDEIRNAMSRTAALNWDDINSGNIDKELPYGSEKAKSYWNERQPWIMHPSHVVYVGEPGEGHYMLSQRVPDMDQYDFDHHPLGHIIEHEFHGLNVLGKQLIDRVRKSVQEGRVVHTPRDRTSAANPKWAYLNGHVAFGDYHHGLIDQIAAQAGLNRTEALRLSNLVAAGVYPHTNHDFAIGDIRGKYPHVWISTVDRNAVMDKVLDKLK